MKLLIIAVIILSMFCATVYSVDCLVKNGRVAYVGETEIKNTLTNIACYVICIVTVAYDAAAYMVLLKLV